MVLFLFILGDFNIFSGVLTKYFFKSFLFFCINKFNYCRLKDLNISNNGMSGVISTEIASLRYLKKFNESGNLFTAIDMSLFLMDRY